MARKWLAGFLAFVMLVIALTSKADAGFSSSGLITCPSFDRAGDMGRVQRFLETKAVRSRLADLGFSPSEITERISGLTDSQLHAFAANLDEAKVGGGAEGVFIGVAVIILFIFVVLPLLGVRVWR
jgi:hypothetical protein